MLELDKMTVLFVRLHEFAVIPTCDDSTCLKHIDTIYVLDRRQAMGDDDRCTSLHESLKGFLDESLSFRIKGTCRFIEDEDLWICEYSASDRNTLFLSSWELQSSLSYLSLPAFWEWLDEVEDIRFFTRLSELFLCHTISYIFEIVTDRFIK